MHPFGTLKTIASRTSGPLLLLLVIGAGLAEAQDYITAVGRPTFTTHDSVELGFVNVANGNMHLEIPLATFPQRGRAVDIRMVYDSRIWRVFDDGVSRSWQPTNVPGAGWRFVSSVDRGSVTYEEAYFDCGDGTWTFLYGPFYWTAPDGTVRKFAISTREGVPQCLIDRPGGSAMAEDSSGFRMNVTNYTIATVIAPDGTQLYPTAKDTNGNYFSVDANGNIIDTLQRTPVTKTVVGNQTHYDILTSQGTRSRYTVTTTTINVNTNFGQAGVTEYAGTLTVVQSIAFPDGSSYTFSYDSGTTPGKFGLLTQANLRTGGQINYGYVTFQDVNGNRNRWVSSKTLPSGTRSYTPTMPGSCPSGYAQCQRVTLTKPNNESVIYTFGLAGAAWNVEEEHRTAATSTILKVKSSYTAGSTFVRKLSETVTLPGAQGDITAKTEYLYDSPGNGNITAVKEWQFLNGSNPTFSSTPDRETTITYLATSAYSTKNIIDRVTAVAIYQAAVKKAETLFEYDTTALTSVTGATQHDDAAFGTANTTRGNRTLTKGWEGTAYLSTTAVFDTTGQLRQMTDPKGNTTTFSYANNFYTDDGNNPPSPYLTAFTNAYVTQITFPLIGNVTLGYYFGSGKPALRRDVNLNYTYEHFQDALDRYTKGIGPAGAWTLVQYPSAIQSETYRAVEDVTASTSCTSCTRSQRDLDSLGRPLREVDVNDPEGATTVQRGYDAIGRVSEVTNPHRTTIEPTYGTTFFSYDALNRLTGETKPDGTTSQRFYGSAVVAAGGRSSQLCTPAAVAYPLLSKDESQLKRQLWIDAWGRLIEVDEQDAGGALTKYTCYSYDVLDNVTEIKQYGVNDNGQTVAQTRTATYDALSRLKTITLPEYGPGTVTYSYWGSTLQPEPCSGAERNICKRTDARNIVTTYAYDALNRLMSKTYSDSTPSVTFVYDATTYNGLAISNPKGNLVGMSDGSGQTAWSYNAAGQVLQERRTINSSPANVTKDILLTYTAGGAVKTIQYPSGRILTYEYSAAGRPTAAKDLANNVHYAKTATYAPHGAVSSVLLGNDSGAAGATLTREYNNRLQVTRIRGQSSITIFDVSLVRNMSGANNGWITRVVDNRASDRTADYSYDLRGRLASASTVDPPKLWGNTYSVDDWANLEQKNLVAGYQNGETLTQSASETTNRIVGLSYDAAGNTTNDGVRSYTWDAENRLTSSAGGATTYSYDGFDLRVRKSGYRLYWRGPQTDVLAETQLDGVDRKEYVYFAGMRIAFVNLAAGGNGNRYYYYADHLGTTHVMTNGGGTTVMEDSVYYPWGKEALTPVDQLDNRYKFTGQELDPETNNYYFAYRYYSPRLARFLSPDPVSGRIEAPQSQNRYAYVQDAPSTFVDPLGLETCPNGVEATVCVVDTPAPGETNTILVLAPGTCADVFADNVKIGNTCDPDPMWITECETRPSGVSPCTIGDVLLNPLAREVIPEIGRTASQVIHPCTIASWYTVAAAGAVTGLAWLYRQQVITTIVNNAPTVIQNQLARAGSSPAGPGIRDYARGAALVGSAILVGCDKL